MAPERHHDDVVTVDAQLCDLVAELLDRGDVDDTDPVR